MVAGRPYHAEGIVGLAGFDLVDGETGGTAAAQCRVDTARRHEGVRVERDDLPLVVFARLQGNDLFPVLGGMDERKLIQRGQRSRQHLGAGEASDRVHHGADPFRPFDVAEAGVVAQAVLVVQDQRGHNVLWYPYR